MLARARELADRLGARNVQFVREDDDLALVGGTFDLVHSYIVFQHIAPKRGLRLLRVLASRLESTIDAQLRFLIDAQIASAATRGSAAA